MTIVSGHLVPKGLYRFDPIDPHQPSETALVDIVASLFKPYRHAWTAITAEAQVAIFPDMFEQLHVCTFPLTDRP